MSALRPRSRWGAALGGLAALLGVSTAWGFSVDDALISIRVAHQLALGHGYRFNVDGPSVDCVTPLGWAHVLAPFAGGDVYRALSWASAAGAAAWIAAGALLGWRSVSSRAPWRSASVLLVLAGCLPLSAWAVSGMETAIVMLLGCAALERGRLGALCAGLAAAWRPELLPWAITLAFGSALGRREPVSRRCLALGLALLPALAVAVTRASLFGHPAPLAIFAKPSDTEHGLRYAFGFLLLSGPPCLLLTRRNWRALGPEYWAIAVASAVHVVVLVGIGGDWMPFWRLGVPVLPGVLRLGAAIAERSGGLAHAARLALALSCAALLHVNKAADARGVRAQRARLISEAAPLLVGAERVASVDIGWVGAATPEHVVDLAGVTDPEVAHLPGGHTSKRLAHEFLERRAVDALVLLLEPHVELPAALDSVKRVRAARAVEQHVLTLRGADEFAVAGTLPLTASQSYVVLRRGLARPAQPHEPTRSESP